VPSGGTWPVATPFEVSWSNSSGLTSLTSSGWSGPIDPPEVADGGGLPACPPQPPGDCVWSPLELTAAGIPAAVTLTACQGLVCGTCSYTVTGEEPCGPDLSLSTRELEEALDALGRFHPDLIAPEAVSNDAPIYSWNDNRGWHHVQVEVTDFKIPRIKASSSLFQKCVRVKHAQQEVTVTVRRYDEDNVVSRGWAMRYRTNAADEGFTERPSDAAFSLPFGIKSVSKARHGYKPNSVWIVADKVTK